MGNIDAYLSRLDKGLLRMDDSEREDVIEEIQSHIEDGAQDPEMGASEVERRQKIMSELGHPGRMASGINDVYQRYSWLDVVLMIAIYFVIWPLRRLIKLPNNTDLYVLILLPIFFSMILIARRRSSAIPEAWWLSQAVLYISLGLFMARMDVGHFTSIPSWIKIPFWSILLIPALSWFAVKLWRSSGDGFLIVFLLLPIVPCASAFGIIYVMKPTLDAYTSVPSTSYPGWLVDIAIRGITFACALMLPQRSKRWTYLIIGMIALAIHSSVLVYTQFSDISLTVILGYTAIILSYTLIPVAIGLAIEYRYTGRNPLLLIHS